MGMGVSVSNVLLKFKKYTYFKQKKLDWHLRNADKLKICSGGLRVGEL